MRKVERIEPFLKELGKIWGENVPDWRFGQLIFNLISEMGDPFYWEEDMFLEKLREYFTPKEEEVKEDTEC